VRRILVTGASGFVGGHLRPALREAFPSARLMAATRGESVADWDEAVTLDLLEPAGCREAVRAAKPDALIHLAALAAPGKSFDDPVLTWRVNLLGTVAIGEAVLASAAEAVFVQASSVEVYGHSFLAGRVLAEDAPLRPANPYAASKAAAELAVEEMARRGLRAIVLRPCNHTGAGQSEDFVVAAFARQAALIAAGKQEPVMRVGALDRWRDFLDVADVCAGYVAALRHAATLPPGAVFNLASGQPKHIGTILEDISHLAGIAARIEEDPARMRPTDPVRTEADAGAARATLGWTPRVPWEETLAAVVADWRARIS
jgi:GDP-4-dehydro-6-deoxy-D-mannose reductase